MDSKAFSREIGSRVRVLRESMKISQEALADLAGLHRTYIGMVERGERQITVWSLMCICLALNTNLAEFLNNVDAAGSNENTDNRQ